MVNHLPLQRRIFIGEELHHVLLMVVSSEVRVVLVYFTLHVQVLIHLNEKLGHV